MTVLDEKRCRLLVGKLCSGLGWSVHPAPAVRYVLRDRKGRRITFGQSMSEIVESLCYWSWTWIDDPDVMPTWLRECSSPEELELKTEVAL